MRKILVIGAAGQIGSRAVMALEKRFETAPVVHNHCPPGMDAARTDITDQAAVTRLLESTRPHAVINLAAVADANACQKDPALAAMVNVDGAANVARACARVNARLVHYSTDLVFDGTRGMYSEDDPPAPVNVYGVTKAESESAVLDACPDAAVLRTAIVYGPGAGIRPSFFESAVRRAMSGERVGVFTDEIRSFVGVDDSAEAAAAIIDAGAAGMFHAGGGEPSSRHDFMKKVFAFLNIDPGLLDPVKIGDVPSAAPRPADCSLASDKLRRMTGWRPEPFETVMVKFAESLRT